MKGHYIIQVFGFDTTIEVTHFTPFIKGNYDGHPEYCYPDEEMEFEWSSRSGNQLLDYILENKFAESIDETLGKILK